MLGAVSNDGRLAALSNGVEAGPIWSSDNRLLWFVDEAHALRWWDPATGAQAPVVGDVVAFGLRPGGAADAHPETAAPS